MNLLLLHALKLVVAFNHLMNSIIEKDQVWVESNLSPRYFLGSKDDDLWVMYSVYPFLRITSNHACKTNEWSTNFRFYNHSLQNSALRRVVWVKWRRVVGDAKSPWKVPLVILMFSNMNVLLPFVKVNYVFPFFMLYSRKPITLEDTLNTS